MSDEKTALLWIDSHAHLDQLSLPVSEALEAAQRQGVFRIITIGTEMSDWDQVLYLSKEESPLVYGALGLHPCHAGDFSPQHEQFLRENLKHKRIVALGEIGLDYSRKNVNKKTQWEVFEKQLAIASEFQLAVEIHSRSAEEDTAFFLKQHARDTSIQNLGLLHCFTSSYQLAKQALDCGFNISFSGILSFKNAGDLREICKKIPLDRLHIETDSPFLSPEPYRGRENHPARVSVLAHFMAELRGLSPQDLSQQLKQNTYELFPKIKAEEERIERQALA